MAYSRDGALDDLTDMILLAGFAFAGYFFLIKPALAKQNSWAVTDAVVDSTTTDWNAAMAAPSPPAGWNKGG